MTALSFRDRRSIAGEIRRAEGVPGGSAPPPSHRFPVLAVMIAALLFCHGPDAWNCPACGRVADETLSTNADGEQELTFFCARCQLAWARGEQELYSQRRYS